MGRSCCWLFCALLLGAVPLRAGTATPKPGGSPGDGHALRVGVDPRVELICIIFRLAGHREYNDCRLPGYVREVDERFGPHREHAVVRLARELRRTRGVSFDAPMSLAVHLKDADTLALQVPLAPWPAELDRRWREKELKQFLSEARRFALETGFRAFFDAHRALYSAAGTWLMEFLNRDLRREWFDRFYGAPPGGRLHVVIGMLNGPHNYGLRARVGGRGMEIYAVLGAASQGLGGIPVFGQWVIPTVVHEFCHSYVNPLVDRHASEMRAPAEKLFARVEERMKRMAYGGWQVMLYESLVRASTIRYLAAENTWMADCAIEEEVGRGFLWMRELVNLLGEYEANRAPYPTMESFAPRLAQFFAEYRLSEEPPAETPGPRP